MRNESKYDIVPFNGTNYSLWCRRVEAIFAAQDLDKYLVKEPDAVKVDEVKHAKKAYALLLTLLNDNILASLYEQTSASQIWLKLKSTYMKDGAVSQILARKRLATVKKKKETTMRNHVDEMLGLVADLRASGVEVKDVDVVVYLLMSLPSEYDSIKAAIENQPTENLKVDFVTQRLIDAEAMMADYRNRNSEEVSTRKSASSDQMAFVSSKKDIICFQCRKKGHTAKECRKKLICFNCGLSGHIKRDCRRKPKDSEKHESAAVTFAVGDLQNNVFIVDSGSTSHMSSHSEWFSEMRPSSGTVQSASRKGKLEVSGIGTISGMLKNGTKIVLKDVLYVPDLNGELMSVKNIEKAGYTVIFKDEKVIIQKGLKTIVIASQTSRGQYVSDFIPEVAVSQLAQEEKGDLWHRRLGHSSNQVLQKLGLPTPKDFCEECVMAKQTAEPIGKEPRRREMKPMQMIHTDVCGPITPPTTYDERYFVTIIDDFSRFCEVRLLKHKNDLVDELEFFFKTHPSIHKMRCDNAKEYVTGRLVKCARTAGVVIDPAPPYTPYLNGVAERANRSLLDKGRALIFESVLPKHYWGFAILTAAYLRNRIPSNSIGNNTPYFMKYQEKPDLSNIRVFGCDAYKKIPECQRKKLDPKSQKMIFIGYSSMGYRLLDPETKRIVISRNVVFNEKKKIFLDETRETVPVSELPLIQTNPEEEVKEDLSVQQSDPESDPVPDSMSKRPVRNRKAPVRFQDYEVYHAMIVSENNLVFEDIETLSVNEQMQWKKAMEDEMLSINKNKVWELVQLPDGKHSISCKWILRQKRDGKYKARLVARGFMQEKGLDYDETYSPVISMPALRLVFITVLHKELIMYVLDVKTAFLNGDLKETLYMDQPKGYDDGSGRVCKLLKSLYGLKQAPRQWYDKFSSFVNKIKFKQLESEPCIFIRRTDQKEVIMVLYVDDLLIAGSDKTELDIIVGLLKREFEMSKSEVAAEFLGIRLEYNQDSLSLDQEIYIKRLLTKFNMSDCKPCATPLEPKATSADFEKSDTFQGPYRELVGSLLYLAMVTRPDILYAVNCLSQLQEKPTIAAWTGLKRILRYLRGTVSFKLLYEKSEAKTADISVFVDADWGSNPHDRKSITGYIIKVFDCPVAWCVKKQNCIALSSTEAEIIAMGKAMQDTIWFSKLCKELVSVSSVCVFEDNQSAIKSVVNENSCSRLKHLDIKLKFIRETLHVYDFKLLYVCTNEQVADIFTKSLPCPQMSDLRFKCNVRLRGNVM